MKEQHGTTDFLRKEHIVNISELSLAKERVMKRDIALKLPQRAVKEKEQMEE